jgi:hypothetical protein
MSQIHLKFEFDALEILRIWWTLAKKLFNTARCQIKFIPKRFDAHKGRFFDWSQDLISIYLNLLLVCIKVDYPLDFILN